MSQNDSNRDGESVIDSSGESRAGISCYECETMIGEGTPYDFDGDGNIVCTDCAPGVPDE
jgi:hypothetical protein